MVQGIEATLSTGRDVFRVVVPLEALRKRGADPEDPDTWRAVFRANENTIVEKALSIRVVVGGSLVFVNDLPRVPA